MSLCVAPTRGGRYRSLFEDLPPLQVDEEALHRLGRLWHITPTQPGSPTSALPGRIWRASTGPGLIGAPLTAELLADGPQLYRVDGDPSIPFEFADAAYRYGHAQIRDRYQVNDGFGPYPVFPDLMGFGPVAPEHTVDWALQIDVAGHAPAQRAKRCRPRSRGRSRAPTTRRSRTAICNVGRPSVWRPARPSRTASACRR